MLKRSHNSINQPGQHTSIPVELEMAAMEDLGPLARHAIYNAPLGVLATPIVDQIDQHNAKIEEENKRLAVIGFHRIPYLDPHDPKLDAVIADSIVKLNYQLLLKERSPEDAAAGCRPLRRVRALRRAG